MERVERLSLILHVIRICSRRIFSMLDNVGSFGVLNDAFKMICTDMELVESEYFIDYDTCFRASLLTKFYLNQTKILAGYDPITDNILTNKKSNRRILRAAEVVVRCSCQELWDECSTNISLHERSLVRMPLRCLVESLYIIEWRRINSQREFLFAEKIHEYGM